MDLAEYVKNYYDYLKKCKSSIKKFLNEFTTKDKNLLSNDILKLLLEPFKTVDSGNGIDTVNQTEDVTKNY
jgi:hypothetical protein